MFTLLFIGVVLLKHTVYGGSDSYSDSDDPRFHQVHIRTQPIVTTTTISPSVVPVTSTCPTGFTRDCVNDHCYYIHPADMSVIDRSHDQAEAECQRLHPNAHLVSLETIEEFYRVGSRLAGAYKGSSTGVGLNWWTGAKIEGAAAQWVPIGAPYNLPGETAAGRELTPDANCGRLRLSKDNVVRHTALRCDARGIVQQMGYICELEL